MDTQAASTKRLNFDYKQQSVEDFLGDLDGALDFDVVFLMAATSVPGNAQDDIVFDLLSNVVPSVKMAFECATRSQARLVFLSSGGTVYGDLGVKRLVETDPLHPRSAYGAAKLSIEAYLQVLGANYGLDYRIARLSNPFGPGQSPFGIQGLVSVFMRKIALGEPIEIWGDGSATRDYIYVDDVAEGLISIALSHVPQQIFNLASGQGYSVNEMIERIEQVVGSSADVKYLPARAFDVQHNVLDISAVRKATQWQPTTDLKHGLEATWHAMKPILDRHS